MLFWFVSLAHSAPEVVLDPIHTQLYPERPELMVYVSLPHHLPPPSDVPPDIAEARDRYRAAHADRIALLRAGADLLDTADSGADWRAMLPSLPISPEAQATLAAEEDIASLDKALRALREASAQAEGDALAEVLAWAPPPDDADAASEWAWYTLEQSSLDYHAQIGAYDDAWSAWAETSDGPEPSPPAFDHGPVDAILAHTQPNDPFAALLRLHVQHLSGEPYAAADLELLMDHEDAVWAEDARLRRAILHDESGEYAEAAELYATVPRPEARHLEAEALRQLRDWDAAAEAMVLLLGEDISDALREDTHANLVRVALIASDVHGESLADRLTLLGAATEQGVWEAAIDTALRDAPDQLPPLVAYVEASWPSSGALEPARAWRPPSAELARAVRIQAGQMISCVERLPWQGSPPPISQLDVRLRVRQGAVRSVSIDGTADPDLSACIERRAAAWALGGRTDLIVPVIIQ